MQVQIFRKDKEPIYFEHHNHIDEDYRTILSSTITERDTIKFRFCIGKLFIDHIFTKSDFSQPLLYKETVKKIR